MSTAHFFDDYGGAWGTSLNADHRQTGTRIIFSTGGYVTGLRFYRDATGAAHAPTDLKLWDAVTLAVVASVASPTDSGVVGWQESVLPVPVQLVAGREYRVSGQVGNATNYASFAGATAYAPPAPLYAASTHRCYGDQNTTDTFPNNVDSVLWVGFDVTWTDTPPGVTPPASDADVANQFAAWLSTTDGTHSDSAPLQDHATLATVDTNTADVSSQVNEWAFGLGAAAHGYYATIQALIDDVKSVTDDLPTPIARLSSVVLDHYSADIAGILAQIDSVLSGLGAQSTDLSGTSGSAVGALSGRTGFPATGWGMSAEADFEDAIAFAEPADAYVLSITSYQDTQPANESPAGLWLPRLGWWCVLNGSLATQRQFVDFEQMLLDDQGRRMPGCAIQLRPGTIATVQAWLLA